MSSSISDDNTIPLLLSPSPQRPTTPITSSDTGENFFGPSLKSPSPNNSHKLPIHFKFNAASLASFPETIVMKSGSQEDPMIIDSDNESTDDSDSFPQFRKLPTQIRCKIWAMNLPGARLVEVVLDRVKEAWGTNAPTIANLFVCRESRREALKSHPLSFRCYCGPGLIPFNFATDTLFLGRKMEGTHAFFRKNRLGQDLAKVQYLMVDAFLKWGNRTVDDRGLANLGHFSHHVFKSVKEHTVLYTGSVDPLPFWADCRWFPWIATNRAKGNNAEQVISRFKQMWPAIPGRVQLPRQEAERHRYGGILPDFKFDPAIRDWRVPDVYVHGLSKDVMRTFNYSDYSSWAMILMDRVVEDIFC